MESASPGPPQGKRTWLRWLWKWLVRCLAVLVVLIVLFYMEEDWRGAHAWAQAKKELEAQGISLDPTTYIPPPVPDAENFGALPYFQIIKESDKPNAPVRLALDNDLKLVSEHLPYSKDTGAEPDSLPYLGNWQKGEVPDMAKIEAQMENFWWKQNRHSPIPPNAKPIDLFGMLCPVLAKLREDNSTHPECRFDLGYATLPAWNISWGAVTEQLKVSKVLSYEERLAFLGGQPDLALDNLKVAWKINSGLAREPFLISGLVSLGVVAIQLAPVNEGLANHRWNDVQLGVLDDDLGKMDCLAENQSCVCGDVVIFEIPDIDYTKTNRRALVDEMMKYDWNDDSPSWSGWLAAGFWGLVPSGWFDQFKTDSAKFNLLGTKEMIDPKQHRVFPEREQAVLASLDNSVSKGPVRYFMKSVALPIFNSIKKFSYQQVQIDEARIASRLERYRLAHGSYPDKLEALVPEYGELPHDVMNGQPYHYKLNPDGTYMIYSVGWDQKDDGGQLGEKSPYHNSDNLDWVWTNYPDPPRK